MIPDEHKNNVILSSITFIRAITRAFGSEEGMRLWETISDTVDTTLKGEVFKAMLTGDVESSIRITQARGMAYNKIDAIKAIRRLDSRGLGLKDAKDAVEGLECGREFDLHVSGSKFTQALGELQNVGLII